MLEKSPNNLIEPEMTGVELENRVRACGLLPTKQRMAVAKYLFCEADHPTADQVEKWADGNCPGMSLATVYNTLNAFVHRGLIREFRFSYTDKTIYDKTTRDHFHFFDESTGKISDLETLTVNWADAVRDDIVVTGVDVLVRGRKISL